jgi:hypothetical protein
MSRHASIAILSRTRRSLSNLIARLPISGCEVANTSQRANFARILRVNEYGLLLADFVEEVDAYDARATRYDRSSRISLLHVAAFRRVRTANFFDKINIFRNVMTTRFRGGPAPRAFAGF